MSKLVRALTLGAILVAMSLAAATAVAQDRNTDAAELFRAGERAAQKRTATDAAELFRAGERAAQKRTATDAAELYRAGERASQAHRDEARTTPDEAPQPARRAEPTGRAGLLLALGVLIAALAAGAATHVTRRVRARHAV
jgi:hypothetical protein